MKPSIFSSIIVLPLFITLVSAQDEQVNAGAEEITILPTLVIRGQEKANLRPAMTYESPISNLDFDPRLDIQSRNMTEAQGDISIRGGIFENTGIRVGSATLFDPQTGHYTTELPIAPEMLEGPKIYTGAENALRGFNSNVGTIGYDWSKIKKSGSLTFGGGDNSLNFQRLHNAWTDELDHEGWSIGYETEFSRSESDGTVPYSDHDFSRTTARVQLLGPNSQTDFFAGYQSKFFGQFGMYTGDQYNVWNPYETENIKTRLILLNHRQIVMRAVTWSSLLITEGSVTTTYLIAFHPTTIFVHETEVQSVALSGYHAINEQFGINHNLQFTSDDIESSALEQGKFTDREFYKLSVLPEYRRDFEETKRFYSSEEGFLTTIRIVMIQKLAQLQKSVG